MFKENFIRFCNERGEAPCYVCRQVNITSATFSKWTDESIPRRATLMRISDYLGVSIQELLADVPSRSSDVTPSAVYSVQESMFWKTLVHLCNEKGISPNFACHELGLSSATSTKWKSGAIPRAVTLKKLSNYFGVSPEFLLTGSDSNNFLFRDSPSPSFTADRTVPNRLLNIINIMSDEELDVLEAFAVFLISRKKGIN